MILLKSLFDKLLSPIIFIFLSELINKPKILLLDEPTASLDPDTGDYIRSYLENILSEFNHLVSVLLKGDKVVETTQILINQKIVGHA